jgi:hypothetical protein
MVDQEVVDRISEPVLKEYRDFLRGLRDTIRAMPEEEWASGDKKGDVPVRHACHLLRALARCCSKWKIDYSDRFSGACATFSRNVDPEDFPKRAVVLECVDDVEPRVEAWVPEVVRQTVSGKRKRHPPLGRAMYILRHSIVHLAYIRREMYRRGIPRPPY